MSSIDQFRLRPLFVTIHIAKTMYPTTLSWNLIPVFISLHLCVLSLTGILFSQETSTLQNLNSLNLKSVLVDTFDEDTRSKYQISGEIDWEPGRITLHEDASLERKIEIGTWGKVDLHGVHFEPSKANELRLWLIFDESTNCYVSIQTTLDDGQNRLGIALVHNNENLTEKLIRRSLHTTSLPNQLTFEYRAGFFRVTSATQLLLAAQVPSSNRDITKLRLESKQGDFDLKQLSVSTDERYLMSSLKSRQRNLGEILRAVTKLKRLQKQNQATEATKFLPNVLEIKESIVEKSHPNYAQVLIELAKVSSWLDQNSLATELFAEAREARRNEFGEEHPFYATVLSTMATHYASRRQFELAEPLFIETRKICRQVYGTNHPNYITTINSLAAIYSETGNLDRAEPLYLEVKDAIKRNLGTQHPRYARSLNNLAMLYSEKGQYEHSETLHLEACQIRKQVLGENHPDYANSLQNLASLYMTMGQYARAEPLYVQSRDIWKNSLGPKHPNYGSSLNGLGLFYSHLGEYKKAEKLFWEAKEICEAASKTSPGYNIVLDNLAVLYDRMGEYTRAESFALESLKLRESIFGESHPQYATSLTNVASLYVSIGDYPRAEPILIKALALRRKVLGEDHPLYGASLNNLARMYQRMDEFEKAVPLFIEALDIAKNSIGESHPNYILGLNNLAVVYNSMKQHSKAEALYIEAQKRSRDSLGVEHELFSACLSNLATYYLSIGDYERAEPLLIQSCALGDKPLGSDHPNYALRLHNLASVYEMTGKYIKAEQNFRHAFNVMLNASEKALPQMSQSQAMNWMTENELGVDRLLSLWRRHELDNDTNPYTFIWKSKFLATRLKSTTRLPTTHLPETKQKFDQLRDTRIKLAQMLSATPAEGDLDKFRTKLEQASKEKERLEKELAAISPLTERGLRIRDASIEDLTRILPPNTAIIDFSKLDHWTPINQQIETDPEDESSESRTVKYSKVTSIYDAFVVRPDQGGQIPWVNLGPSKPIDVAIEEWRKYLTLNPVAKRLGNKATDVSADDPVTNFDHRLRELVWNKLEPHLKGCDTVILLPDGELNHLPWAALPGNKPNSFLIHDYAISTGSYGQQLYGLLSDDTMDGKSLTIAGGLNYDRRQSELDAVDQGAQSKLLAGRGSPELRGLEEDWEFLPGTMKEASAVEGIWNSRGKVDVFTDADATELDLAKSLSSSRYAHLATHGFFSAPSVKSIWQVNLREQSLFRNEINQNDRFRGTVGARNPLLLSGLVLSGANLETQKDKNGIPTGEDGILTAEEVVGLDLRNLELVTLSACETGLGDVAAGEGVFGLQRAFHQAGARSVIASLWKVDDQATQALMVEFYKNLWNKKMSKVEALRQAQLTMLNSYDKETGSLRGFGDKSVPVTGKNKNSSERLNPRYWAAFQLSGDWR